MRKTFILILSCTLICVLLISILYLHSTKINSKGNSFVRQFPSHIISNSKSLDIEHNSYYIAGVSDRFIYLGNSTAPSFFLISDYTLQDTLHYTIGLPYDRIAIAYLNAVIDSPNIYLSEGVTPAILQADIFDSLFQNHYFFKDLHFSLSVPLSKTSFILRTYDSILHRNILAKKTLAPDSIKYATNILEKQIDGMFCTDGMLLYEKELQRLIYFYYYRNQFLCLDTNLNILYRGKTIDNIEQARIKVDTVSSHKMTTLSSPPLIVNEKGCISKNYLFINSNILAKHEDEKSFRNSSVIDVYSLTDGVYKFSFYLPNFKEKKMKCFQIRNGKVFALYDHYLLSFDLNLYLLKI